MLNAAGQIAVVTGSSSGIGEAAAVELAKRGWHVALVARTESKLKVVADRIVSDGGSASVHPVDAGDGHAVLAMAQEIRERLGRPSLIVNSAGAGAWKYIEDTSPDEVHDMIAVPYLAAFHVTHAFMRDLREQPRAVIVHVGSPASFCPWPGATGYVASRAALAGLHEALCQDLVGSRVHSCLVTFGEVTTPYFAVNDVSSSQLPVVGRWVPKTPPEVCGRIIADLAERPRRRVDFPRMLAFLRWLHHWFPTLTRWIARQSPRQQQRVAEHG